MCFNLYLSEWEKIIHLQNSRDYCSPCLATIITILSLGTLLGPLVPQCCVTGSGGGPDSDSGSSVISMAQLMPGVSWRGCVLLLPLESVDSKESRLFHIERRGLRHLHTEVTDRFPSWGLWTSTWAKLTARMRKGHGGDLCGELSIPCAHRKSWGWWWVS